MDIKNMVVKAYEEKTLREIADAPVDALQGVSKSDAELLQKAFNIKAVRDLADLKYFDWAQNIVAEAEASGLSRVNELTQPTPCGQVLDITTIVGGGGFGPDQFTAWNIATFNFHGVISRLIACEEPCIPKITRFELSQYKVRYPIRIPGNWKCSISAKLALTLECKRPSD